MFGKFTHWLLSGFNQAGAQLTPGHSVELHYQSLASVVEHVPLEIDSVPRMPHEICVKQWTSLGTMIQNTPCDHCPEDRPHFITAGQGLMDVGYAIGDHIRKGQSRISLPLSLINLLKEYDSFFLEAQTSYGNAKPPKYDNVVRLFPGKASALDLELLFASYADTIPDAQEKSTAIQKFRFNFNALTSNANQHPYGLTPNTGPTNTARMPRGGPR